jgi:SpoVK/Ycf46/Vps4 family AAA+-type ATPase
MQKLVDVGKAAVDAAYERQDTDAEHARKKQELEELKLDLEIRKSLLDQANSRRVNAEASKTTDDEGTSLEKLRPEMEALRVTKPTHAAGLGAVIGLEEVKQLIDESVLWPLQNTELFSGIRAAPRGVLLYGPPGCGKTLLAKALATEAFMAGASFFNVPPGALMGKYYGESQERISALATVVSESSPAVVFFDEVDSLLGNRDEGQVAEHHRSTTNAMLQWMDGFESDPKVFFLAATNLRNRIDPAALRRFHASVEVPLPDIDQRQALLAKLLDQAAKEQHAHEISKEQVRLTAEMTEGSSFDALAKALTRAFLIPLRELPREQIRSITPSDLRRVTVNDLHAAIGL